MLANHQNNWLTVSLTGYVCAQLSSQLKDWLIVCFTDWLTDWVNDRTGLFTQMIFLQDNSDWVIIFFFLVLLFVLFCFFFNRRGKKSRFSTRLKSPSATEAVLEEHTFEEDTKLLAVKFEEIITNSKQFNKKKWQLEIHNLVFLLSV